MVCPLPSVVWKHRNEPFGGVNLDVHRDVPTGVYWHGTLGFTRGYVVVCQRLYNGLAYPPPNYTPTPCTNCANQTIVPGANFISAAYSASVPYASASADLGYRWSPGKFIELSSTYCSNNNIYKRDASLCWRRCERGSPN